MTSYNSPIDMWMRSVLLSSWALAAWACGDAESPSLTLYSGRSQALVEPIVERFRAASGVGVVVRYGGTAELAALLAEEGDATEADVYYGQDAGALGILARNGLLAELPAATLERVDPRFRARDGRWIGVSGRARVLLFNTERVREAELPQSVWGLTEPRFRARVGWAPSNGSFQAFVTAMRILEGEEATRDWLEQMLQNRTRSYVDNGALLDATLRGEIDLGLTNHYYLLQFRNEGGGDAPVSNHVPTDAGAGALVNIAGVGIVEGSDNPEIAQRFVEYLLARESQSYFANETFEYPLSADVPSHPSAQPLSEIATPDLDLSDLSDWVGTLALLRETGVM